MEQLLRKYRSTINPPTPRVPYFITSSSAKHINLYHLETLIKLSYVEQYREILKSHSKPFCSWNGLDFTQLQLHSIHYFYAAETELPIMNNRKWLLHYKSQFANKILITSWQPLTEASQCFRKNSILDLPTLSSEL